MHEPASIRDYAPGDRAAAHALLLAAFAGGPEADLVDALRSGGWSAIEQVAVEDTALAGHVMLSRLDAPMRALALAPICVHPLRQNRGIGTALASSGLAAAAAKGWDAVFVVGDPAFYGRFGFSVAAARDYECSYSGDYFMVKGLAPEVPRHGRILYPPPFVALGT